MNPEDALERELSALRPQGVSPGLKRRIAERLETRRASEWVWDLLPRWRIGLVGGLAAAAAVGLAVFLWPPKGPVTPIEHVKVVPPPLPAPADDSTSPSLGAYQRALAESPDALDALLALHARRFGGSDRSASSLDVSMIFNSL